MLLIPAAVLFKTRDCCRRQAGTQLRAGQQQQQPGPDDDGDAAAAAAKEERQAARQAASSINAVKTAAGEHS
jgi:hypothetical protein